MMTEYISRKEDQIEWKSNVLQCFVVSQDPSLNRSGRVREGMLCNNYKIYTISFSGHHQPFLNYYLFKFIFRLWMRMNTLGNPMHFHQHRNHEQSSNITNVLRTDMWSNIRYFNAIASFSGSEWDPFFLHICLWELRPGSLSYISTIMASPFIQSIIISQCDNRIASHTLFVFDCDNFLVFTFHSTNKRTRCCSVFSRFKFYAGDGFVTHTRKISEETKKYMFAGLDAGLLVEWWFMYGNVCSTFFGHCHSWQKAIRWNAFVDIKFGDGLKSGYPFFFFRVVYSWLKAIPFHFSTTI